jgi:methylated-DNA-[protein]-cysteine S-methyltransferase
MLITDTEKSFYRFSESSFGPVAVIWSIHRQQPSILRILLPRPGLTSRQMVESGFPGSIYASCLELDNLAGQITEFLSGVDIPFSLDLIRLDLCPGFQKRVLQAEHAIPRGRVCSYGKIAGHLGHSGAARAVGSALAKNPFPIIVPCHRAIRSNGQLGGFQGGLEMKKALLKMEGILLDDRDRVLSGSSFY